MFNRLAPLIVMVASLPAWAGGNQESEAEHTRLAEEMRRLAGRNAWRGVEANYYQMLELAKKGVVLTYDDHLFGAQAARDAGKITQVYERLERAKNVDPTKEVLDWMTDIDASYGRVELVRDERFVGDSTLTVAELPFAPDQRSAIGTAQSEAVQTGGYVGLLPFGKYGYGGQEFEVKPGGAVVKITLAPAVASTKKGEKGPKGEKADKPAAKRRDGFRFDLGPMYTAVGESSAPGVHPEPYGGMGLRAGLGWEVELSRNIGLLAEAGYHGMLTGASVEATSANAGTDLTANPQVDGSKDSLTLFYLWGGASYWIGNLAIMAGPSWAGGTAKTTGLVANCDDATAPGCDTVASGASDSWKQVSPVNAGFVKTGGLTAGAFYGFSKVPGMRTARLGVSLYGGAQSDLAILYPWAQFAISIAPGL